MCSIMKEHSALDKRRGHGKNGSDLYVDCGADAPIRDGIFVSFWIEIFFKRGRPLFLQSITMAMGCHSLGSIYHILVMRSPNHYHYTWRFNFFHSFGACFQLAPFFPAPLAFLPPVEPGVYFHV